ncbi:MAG: hypothetical protein AAF743_04010, partial [Planctomycetota bacterium]
RVDVERFADHRALVARLHLLEPERGHCFDDAVDRHADQALGLTDFLEEQVALQERVDAALAGEIDRGGDGPGLFADTGKAELALDAVLGVTLAAEAAGASQK